MLPYEQQKRLCGVPLRALRRQIWQVTSAVAFAFTFVFPAASQTYEGNDCTEDCSGHRAGYEWAAENGVTSQYDCAGNSQSFAEGCASYVENQDRSDTSVDDEGNEIPEE